MQPKTLSFTGERFTPECVREIWYEHWHRYAFARNFATGKRVLDAACGEGYGAALLSQTAADVIGVDNDTASIAHARARYLGLPRLRFEQADATALDYAPATFDLVVSFETLEHLAAQEQLVGGFSRVLTDDGVLLISSPDKRNYSDLKGFRNEYHVRELYRDELMALLRPHFPEIRLYRQKLLFQSVLWAADETGESEAWTAATDGSTMNPGLDYEPMYFVAVCSKKALPAGLPAMSLFGDREESVYAHYNHEIQKNMSAGARIAELEEEVKRLRTQLQATSSVHKQAPGRWWNRNRSP